MPKNDDGFRGFVLDQLTDLRGLTCRAMFGGYGLYQGHTFFGIVHQGRLYFKTNQTTAGLYRDRGMKPFQPSSTQRLKDYYEVPVEVLETAEELLAWASQATDL
ncbi:MAG TPA: TfoX/Sxy family protein [Nitrospira sp.]|nr:TfoX/Sxy family protein [Nitrospira sp.]